MPEKKPPGESYESFVDRQIREAEAEGAFENLPGFGKPIPGLEKETDENWWIREKMKREQIQALPPILEVKLEVEQELDSLAKYSSERQVRKLVERLNQRIREAHYSHIPGPREGILPLDLEVVLARWQELRQN